MGPALEFAHFLGTLLHFFSSLLRGLLGFLPDFARCFRGTLARVFCAGLRLIYGLARGVGDGFGNLLRFCTRCVSCFRGTLARVFCAGLRLIYGLARGVGNGFGSLLRFRTRRVSCFLRPVGGLLSCLLRCVRSIVGSFLGTLNHILGVTGRSDDETHYNSKHRSRLHIRRLLFWRG